MTLVDNWTICATLDLFAPASVSGWPDAVIDRPATVCPVYGLLVAGVPGLNKLPSSHYVNHFQNDATADLIEFTKALLDGARASTRGGVEVVPIEERAEYARVALLDVDAPQLCTRSYVVQLFARNPMDLARTPANHDGRGTPSLLTDVRHGPDWQLYNCELTLVSWPREEIYSGRYPPR